MPTPGFLKPEPSAGGTKIVPIEAVDLLCVAKPKTILPQD